MNKLLVLMASLTVWANALWADDSGVVQPMIIACNNCHDTTENSYAILGPNLAGQNRLYLIKRIDAFLGGIRNHPVLSVEGAELDPAEKERLATYYANLVPTIQVDQSSKEGELLYAPCVGCHGLSGEGMTPFPRLLGQNADYLEQQLNNFKTGQRQNLVMQAMSINLSDHEIKLLAGYLGTEKVSTVTMTGEVDSIDPSNDVR